MKILITTWGDRMEATSTQKGFEPIASKKGENMVDFIERIKRYVADEFLEYEPEFDPVDLAKYHNREIDYLKRRLPKTSGLEKDYIEHLINEAAPKPKAEKIDSKEEQRKPQKETKPRKPRAKKAQSESGEALSKDGLKKQLSGMVKANISKLKVSLEVALKTSKEEEKEATTNLKASFAADRAELTKFCNEQIATLKKML